MKQRLNNRVVPGQVWRSSDPRRLSAFEIVAVGDYILAENVYPDEGLPRTLRRAAFQILGPKGYTLMQDVHAL